MLTPLPVSPSDIRNLLLHISVTDYPPAYQSLRTVGSLLFANADFRVFLSDLQTVGRQIFRDSALATSHAAEDIANKVEPDGQPQDGAAALKATDSKDPPSKQEVTENAKGLADSLGQNLKSIGSETQQSAKEHFSESEKDVLLKRLQSAVQKLKQRPDYNDSVSTVAVLLKRYCFAYSRAAEDSLTAIEDDVQANPEVDLAVRNFWSFLSSFGKKEDWEELSSRMKAAVEHQRHNPDFEKLVTDVANGIQKLLTDPATISHADEKLAEIRQAAKESTKDTSASEDLDSIFDQLKTVWDSLIKDEDVSKLIQTSFRIFGIFSPENAVVNPDLFHDIVNEYGPLLIQAIQYVPIPRLEISVPEIDLLLENLIIEPGKTINNSSFLPFKLRLETYNDVEIRKARMRTVSTMTSLFTVKIEGLSMRADDIGFWMRAHAGFFRLADEGIASFQVDERGVDIHLDVEIGQNKLEKVLTLKGVRVRIHKLSYDLRKSKFAWLAWLLKPLAGPIIRKVMEKQMATAIADMFHAANRELLFARERLRATRISDPQDLATFVKAIITRLSPEPDPDVFTRVGVAQPGKGVFKGVYAPGSVVRVWNEEGSRASEVVEDFDRGGWRNDVFNVSTATAA